MLKKTTLAALAATIVLTVASTSFANPGGMHHRGGDDRGYIAYKMEQMTPDQKTTWKAWKSKNVELKKQIISKSATWGWITPDQAKERMEKLTTWAASDQPMHKTKEQRDHKDNDWKMKSDSTKDHKQSKEEMNQKRLDFQANMTEEQKSQLKQWRSEKAQLRTEWINQQYKWGWITKDQADYKVQQMSKWAEKDPFQYHDKQQHTEKRIKN